jgi:hypothetical protein
LPVSPTRARARSSRRRRARAVLTLAALVVALAGGCAGPADDDLFGLELDVRSSLPWAKDPALRPRLHDLVAAACEHVGLDRTLLWGMTLRIVDEEIPCGPVPDARGCTLRGEGLVSVSTLAWAAWEPPVPCVEDTPIPHELLHVKIGDPEHTDARWEDPVYWRPLSSRVARTDCSGAPVALMW